MRRTTFRRASNGACVEASLAPEIVRVLYLLVVKKNLPTAIATVALIAIILICERPRRLALPMLGAWILARIAGLIDDTPSIVWWSW